LLWGIVIKSFINCATQNKKILLIISRLKKYFLTKIFYAQKDVIFSLLEVGSSDITQKQLDVLHIFCDKESKTIINQVNEPPNHFLI